MRCVFSMFAEDIGLLPDNEFRTAVEVGLGDLNEFPEAMRGLWAAMDEGKRFGLRKLLRFNGRFFADVEVLPVEAADLAVLLEAAQADWRHVEPTIFGTLLTRALDPEERHKLGAEYTPREFIERVVRPTIEDPIRTNWVLVQAEVLQLREHGTRQAQQRAIKRLREFHGWLRTLQVLDPACGAGNFLYVALSIMKSVELEVVREIEGITGQSELSVQEIDPSQFHGIEVKAWAREIAELTIWIGHHQWWRRTHGHAQPPEPVLRDTQTLEHRDAVLQWKDAVVDSRRSRPDPTPRIPHPVTGSLVPDPNARVPYIEYRGARPAEWPRADFIVGNPPYMGQARMRSEFGDGYVDSLRAAYPEVPETADYVMYWWYRAAELVATGSAIQAGLITTNTITQAQNRIVVQQASERGAAVSWAIPDHPWIDDQNAADVRVAMTVLTKAPTFATRIDVDDDGQVVNEIRVSVLNADLTAHADVPAASGVSLLANEGLSVPGFKLHGEGFILEAAEAEALLAGDPTASAIIKPYRHGRDLTARPRGVYVIDFGLTTEAEARAFPVIYDIVRTRVKPHRDANPRPVYRNLWWRFGEPRREFRDATVGLRRYIATIETSKHRFFVFLPDGVAPDNKLICIASESAFHLGILSSAIHVEWARAAGGRLVDRPVYVKSACFDAFPFPDPGSTARDQIAALAERLEQHRKDALARDNRVTMTGMYNVIAKLKGGAALTDKEREVHDLAACGVLLDLHEELDELVAHAYGWPWPLSRDDILVRVVSLHESRAHEERSGKIKWLRPSYQIPRYGKAGELPVEQGELATASESMKEQLIPWPKDTLAQLAALRDAVQAKPGNADEIALRFKGAPRADIAKHLDALAVLAVVERFETDVFHAAPSPVALEAPGITGNSAGAPVFTVT